MHHGYTVGEASRYLKIDPKTLHRRCRQLGITPFLSSFDGRVKLYSQEQVQLIAQLISSASRVSSVTTSSRESVPNSTPRAELPLNQLQTLHRRMQSLEKESHEIGQLMKTIIATLRA